MSTEFPFNRGAGDDGMGDSLCYQNSDGVEERAQDSIEITKEVVHPQIDQVEAHGPTLAGPPRRSDRVPKRKIHYEQYDINLTLRIRNGIGKENTPSAFIPPCEAAMIPVDLNDTTARILTASPGILGSSEEATKKPRLTKRDKITPVSRESSTNKRGHKSYSDWTCRAAPPDILSMLRFDHPPELLKLPSEAVVQSRREESRAIQCQSSMSKKPRINLKVPCNDRSGITGENGREIHKKPSDVTPRPIKKPQKPKEGIQPLQNVSVKEEIQIVPLPRRAFRPSRGTSSSDFCKVLRILAKLPRPERTERQNRRPPSARPPVWAESRQELCEALPYYRSFQSGLYMHRRIAFGYLLEAFPAPRDIWAHGGKVIISHGGGQCIRTLNPDGTPGPAALQADQSRQDARVDALLSAHEKKIPIILIAGKGYEGLPWDLECGYIVLGWYWISLTWVEAEPAPSGVKPPMDRDYFHRYKIRFDWVQSQGEPWWINPATSANIVKDEHRWSRESSPLTALPSDDKCYPLHSPRPIHCWSHQDFRDVSHPHPEAHEILEVTCQSPKLKIKSLLNPIELPPTPPRSSPESPTIDCQTPSPTYYDNAKNMKSIPSRPHWPGDRLLETSKPILTVADISLKQTHIPSSEVCPTCHKTILKVYQEGLICLRPECKAFFMLKTSFGLMPIPPGFHLTYNEEFLDHIPTPPEVKIPYDVVPDEPIKVVPETDEVNGEVGGRILWRGWVCKKCGRANCRYRWEIWICRNCGNTLAPINPPSIILRNDLPIPQTSFMGDGKIDPSSGITCTVRLIKEIGCICMIYDLPAAGKVYHLVQPRSSVSDELLEEYQIAANQGGWFQRRALKGTAVKGQFLAQHFAVNFGASYKYQVDTLSYPFEEAPKCVLMSLALITNRVKLILGEEIKFNEILSVMYREGQKMSWHDDGEAGLGPIVSSLSLGNQAIMSFKLKTPRTNLNNTFYKGTLESKNLAPTCLSFTLSHGDIMIMQGREIQKKYDHKVVPMGFRIASTARVIGEI